MNLLRLLCGLAIFSLASLINAQNLFPCSVKDKIGFKNDSGTWLIEPQFDGLSSDYQRNIFMVTKGSTIYLVGHTFDNLLLLIPNAREVKFLQNDYLAVKNINGLWALCTKKDVLGSLKFRYNEINNFGGNYLVRRGSFVGVIDSLSNVVIPTRFMSITRPLEKYLLVKASSGCSILSADNPSNVVLSSRRIQVLGTDAFPIFMCSDDPRKWTYLNENLDTFRNEKLAFHSMFKSHLVFRNKHKYKIINYTGDQKSYSGLDPEKDIVLLSANFLWLKNENVLFGPNGTKELRYESYKSLSDDKLIVGINKKFGILDGNFKESLPCNYSYFDYVNDSFIAAYNKDSFALFNIKKNEVCIQGKLNPKFLIKPNLILATYFHGKAIYYSMDDHWKVEDQITLHNNRTIVPSSVSTDMSWNSGLRSTNLNNQLPSFWYRNRKTNRIGLRSQQGDTLIRSKFLSIIPFNDSLTWTVEPAKNMNLTSVSNGPRIVLKTKMGLVNQNTGRYVISPNYYFVDLSDFKDTASKYARAISLNGYFYLIEKKSGKRLYHTASKMILPRVNGLWGAYRNPIYYNLSNNYSGPDYSWFGPNHWLTGLGQTVYSRNSGIGLNIYMKNKGVNVLDSSGAWVFTDTVAQVINSIKHIGDKNIIIKQDKDFGLLDRKGNYLLTPKYADIERLGNTEYLELKLKNVGKGIVNDLGEVLIPPVYSRIGELNESRVIAYSGNRTFLLNGNGQKLTSWSGRAKSVTYGSGIGAVRQRGGYILIDESGSATSERRFRKVNEFISGTGPVATRVYQGIVDQNGNWLMKSKGLQFLSQSQRFIIFKSMRRYRVYNRNGVILKQFSLKKRLEITDKGNALAVVSRKNVKFFNQDMVAMSRKTFSRSARLRNDTVYVIRSRKLALYNLEKKRIANVYHYGGTRVKSSRYWKVDLKNDALYIHNFQSYQFLYPGCFPLDSARITLQKPKNTSKSLGLITAFLDISVKYNCYFYQEVNTNSSRRIHLYDQFGVLKSNEEFLSVQHWKDDLFIVQISASQGNRFGVINSNGIWVIEPVYTRCLPMGELYLKVSISNLTQICNSNGELISPNSYNKIIQRNGYYLLKMGDTFEWWSPKSGWLHQVI